MDGGAWQAAVHGVAKIPPLLGPTVPEASGGIISAFAYSLFLTVYFFLDSLRNFLYSILYF